MNLSMRDNEMVDLFGRPDLVTEYHRPTMVYSEGGNNRWECGHWWGF